MLIDDFSGHGLVSKLGNSWRGVSDRVMGGISTANLARRVLNGRPRLHLTGAVRIENGGGFIQAALHLSPPGRPFYASGFSGMRSVVSGNNEKYSVHLRTSDNVRPWQSCRAHFNASADWKTVDIPFEDFTPYRLQASLDRSRPRRIGIVTIGRTFYAALALTELTCYI